MKELLERYEKALAYVVPKLTGKVMDLNGLIVDSYFTDLKILRRWLEINKEIGELYKNGDESLRSTITEMIKKHIGE